MASNIGLDLGGYKPRATGIVTPGESTYTGVTPYSTNPPPQAGAGPFGAVPGPIGTPPNIYEQLTATAPELTALTTPATAYVGSEIAGQLTDAEKKALQDQAAAWSYGAGQPMTSPFGIGANKWDTSRLLAVMNREKQGLADYQSLIEKLGATQTPQTLAADIAARNATMGAAPNPEEAFKAMMDEWTRRFNLSQDAARENMMDYFNLVNESREPVYTGTTGPTGWGTGRSSGVSPPIVGGGGGAAYTSPWATRSAAVRAAGGGANTISGAFGFGGGGGGVYDIPSGQYYTSTDVSLGNAPSSYLDMVTAQVTPWNMFDASAPYMGGGPISDIAASTGLTDEEYSDLYPEAGITDYAAATGLYPGEMD